MFKNPFESRNPDVGLETGVNRNGVPETKESYPF
jgi:hypothetical protein